MNILILFGPPGCGKGTQANLLAEHTGFMHLSTGHLSREAIRQDTDMGRKVKEIIEKGRLAPDELIIELIKEHIIKHSNIEGFILDGFPRTARQAELFEQIVKDVPVTILSLTVDEDELTNRLLKRAEIEGRIDDTEEVIRERFDVYKKQTAPVIEFYKNKARIFFVNGVGSVEEIHQNILDVLETN